MRDIEKSVPVSVLRELFRADFEVGTLHWKIREGNDRHTKSWNTKNAGKQVGRLLPSGILQLAVTVNGLKYMSVVHRVLWAMEHDQWPGRDHHIDHRRHDRSANSRNDIRLATPTENMRNKLLYRNNTSGFKGVSFYPRYDKWMSSICINGKLKNLGYFKDPVDAARAYDKAALVNFGEFSKTNADLGLI